MYTPTRIAGREAVFEFLPENLPFIYIDRCMMKENIKLYSDIKKKTRQPSHPVIN